MAHQPTRQLAFALLLTLVATPWSAEPTTSGAPEGASNGYSGPLPPGMLFREDFEDRKIDLLFHGSADALSAAGDERRIVDDRRGGTTSACLRMSVPRKSSDYLGLRTPVIKVQPDTVYRARIKVRTEQVTGIERHRKERIGVSFGVFVYASDREDGNYHMTRIRTPRKLKGTLPWHELEVAVRTGPKAVGARVLIHFMPETTGRIWIDDIEFKQ